MSLDKLVSDWAAFEELIAALCETGDVSVERDVVLVGKSGAPRQINVVVRATQGLTQHLVLVECKYWKRRVTRQHIDSLVTAITDLNASRGMIFSTRGFQDGAITLANHHGLHLFKIRKLERSEQFSPTIPLNNYRHYLWRSIRNVEFPGIHSWDRDLSDTFLAITLGGPGQSKTALLNTVNYPSGTLEGIIDSWSIQAATDLALQARAILFNGEGGVRRFWKKVRQTADGPIEVPVDGAIALIPVIEYDLGVTLWQEHREVDRNDYRFVVAVEDCILGIVHKASRKSEEKKTRIAPTADRMSPDTEPLSHPQHIMALPEWVPFDFDRMDKGRYYDQPGFPEFVPKEVIAQWRDPS